MRFFSLVVSLFCYSVFLGQTVTVYPTASSMNTGYVTSAGTKTTDNMQVSTSTTYGRGWAKFSLANIPANATINSVSVIFYTYGGITSLNVNQITGFTGDPVTMVGSTLYTAIGSGTSFNSSTWTIGTTTSPSLNTKVLSAAGNTFVQNQLAAGSVNIGFVRGSANLHSVYGYSNINYQVRLEISYTVVSCTNSSTILPINSSFSTGFVTSAGVKTSGNMSVSTSTTYGRGWAKFPLTAVPSGAVITAVTVKFYTYGGVNSSLSSSIRGFTGDPFSMTGSSIYSAIGAATTYNNSTWTMGTTTSPFLNTKLLSASGNTFVQNQLATGYVNFGFLAGTSNLQSIYGSTNTLYSPRIEISYDLPTLTPQISASSSTTFCQGDTVSLYTDNISGYTYQWKNNGATIIGATSSSFSATSSGNYTVQVTTSSGCIGTSNSTIVTVNPVPSVTISNVGPTTFCQGGVVSLVATNGTSYSYQWLKNGISILGSTSTTYSANSSGNYTVQVTSSSGCIVSSNSIFVTVNPVPIVTISNVGPTTFCQGGVVGLVATNVSGYSYQWRKNGTNISGATSYSFSAYYSGNYTLQVSNSSGCPFTTVGIDVIVNPLPTVALTSLSPTSFCQGDSAVLTANGNGTFQWLKYGNIISGATNSIYNAYTSGNYIVQVTNTLGCSNYSDSILIEVLSAPDLSIIGDTTICIGDSTILSAFSDGSITWNGNLNQQSIEITPNSDTTYTVSSVGLNGCTIEDQVLVQVGYPSDTTIYTSSYGPFSLNGQVYFESGVYIQIIQSIGGCDSTITINLNYITNSLSELTNLGIVVCPNPSKDGFFYLSSSLEDYTGQIIVLNSLGMIVEKLNFNDILNLSNLSNGVYWLQFFLDGKTIHEKIIKG